jgi:hypothetical protein
MVVEIIFLIDIFDLMWYQHFNEEGARSRKTSALVVLDSVCGGKSGPHKARVNHSESAARVAVTIR